MRSEQIGQITALREHFLSGHRITAMDALRILGIGRLAARVHDLTRSGFQVRKQMIQVEKANGLKVHVAEYWIEQETGSLFG